MGDVGAPELLIILAVVLLLFGGAKLPELARSLGKAKKEFQKGVDEGMPDADHQPLRAAATDHGPEAIAPVAPATQVAPITPVAAITPVAQERPDSSS